MVDEEKSKQWLHMAQKADEDRYQNKEAMDIYDVHKSTRKIMFYDYGREAAKRKQFQLELLWKLY